ncbi:hypothetical protein ACH5RR_017848 [Cinchona calisaya]|uniref:SWIM-type domain-containing protein n=1 Tax=Cinchona calisaya TaxID=153742 RepID=A0ABD2ZKG4_9GENT
MALNKPSEKSIGTFQWLYYFLFACKQGFLDGCRTIIGLDGCFLKSPFGGQLLTAMGRDGSNNMFPIAFTVDEVECYDSWKWFLEFLIGDIGTHNGSIPYTFISKRDKAIITMLECIRRRLMQRIQLKRLGMEKFQGTICPNIKVKFEKNKKLSRGCVAIWAGQKQFEVDTPKGQVVVDLDECTCTCRLFQLTSYPCSHAVSAIQVDRRKKVGEYVDECYTKAACLRSYAHMIHPMPGEIYWVDTNKTPVNPPLVRRQPGKPKKMRRQGVDELPKGKISTRKGFPIT